MAFQSVPDTAQINMVYTLNGEPCQNSLYGHMAGGYILADLIALATQIDVQINSSFLPFQPVEAEYLRTEVRGLASENDLVTSVNTNAGPGRAVSASLPNQVTYSIKKESGLTGRSARGRLYWIGIPRGVLDPLNENLITAIRSGEFVQGVDDMRVGINAVGTWAAALVSRFTDGAKRPTGQFFPWVSTTAVDLVLDTQRERLPG